MTNVHTYICSMDPSCCINLSAVGLGLQSYLNEHCSSVELAWQGLVPLSAKAVILCLFFGSSLIDV